MSLLNTQVRDGVALLTLNDPARRNALSTALSDAIVQRLAALTDDREVGALIVTGVPPTFSAGAVLDDLQGADRDRLRRIYAGFLAVARFPLPTIAAVNGAAVGAGMNLALACDVRIACESARFESRFSELALHPGGGHTWMLRQVLGPQGAASMVLLGEVIDGAEAERRGLVWRCVEDGRALQEALRLAAGVLKAPRSLVSRTKATLRDMAGIAEHDAAVERELEAQLWSIGQPEFDERITALKRRLAERKPRSS